MAMAFGTLSAGLFESSSSRSPEPAVLFYATDDGRAGEEVERLIRAAGFEPLYEIVKVAAHLESTRLFDPADLHWLEAGRSDQPLDFLAITVDVGRVEEDRRLR